MLNQDITYYLSDNCKPRVSGQFIEHVKGYKLMEEDQSAFEVDKRLHLVSYNTKFDITTYVHYFEFVSKIINMDAVDPNSSGRVMSLLDMGYVPLVIAPSFYAAEFMSKYGKAIENINLTLRYEKPMRRRGELFESQSKDIWISRVEAAKRYNIDFRKVNPLKILLEAIANANR